MISSSHVGGYSKHPDTVGVTTLPLLQVAVETNISYFKHPLQVGVANKERNKKEVF